VTSGAVTSGSLFTFALSGGGTLQLDDSQSFHGTVAGFGLPDQIDFRDIPFGSGTTVSWHQLTSGANASGSLTVADGGLTATVTLLGQYLAGAPPMGNFTSAPDNRGGTLVTDPPTSASADQTAFTLVNAQH
jgi:hypothetical protein